MGFKNKYHTIGERKVTKYCLIMKMKHIAITNSEGDYLVKQKFNTDINLICANYANQFYIATAKELNYPIKTSDEGCDLKAKRSICDNGEVSSEISLSKEVLSCHLFDNNTDYSKKLLQYKKKADYYSEKDLDKVTDTFLETKVFRAKLCEFIKNYEAFVLSEKKHISIEISSSGEFMAIQNDALNQKTDLSDEEHILFNFYCFIELNRFWDEVLELQVMNPVKSPLLVLDLIGKIGPKSKALKNIKKQRINPKDIVVKDATLEVFRLRHG